jgi:hypothetical protein
MSRWSILIFALVACSKSEDASTPTTRLDEAKPAAVVKPPGMVGKARPMITPPRPSQLTQVTIKALGMYCEESCPLKVRYALADVPAVYELGFDLTKESIFVSYDASLGTPKEVTKPMLVAIKGAGFDPWLAKESWPADAKADVVAR